MPLETLNPNSSSSYSTRVVVDKINEIINRLNELDKELKDAKNARVRS